MKIFPRRRTRRSGFTLTEMLIVLAILVMLVALVVPRFLGARKKADLQAAQAQIGLFRGALESYCPGHQGFPDHGTRTAGPAGGARRRRRRAEGSAVGPAGMGPT